MTLFEKHKELLDKAIKAQHERTYWAPYPEHPKAYGEDAMPQGEQQYNNSLGKRFDQLQQTGESDWVGVEVSPYTLERLGVHYPKFPASILVDNSKSASKAWKNTSVEERAGILIESLERVKNRFFEIAYATMHTTGQSFMMSFQASGPHANDRAMEAIAMGYYELSRFPSSTDWEKPMGKMSVKLHKTWKGIPKGVGLVIGCSTFPTWNTVPGLYANLITGNTAIVKPHPGAVLPIAIVISEIQKVLVENNFDPNIVQLAADSFDDPITKDLAEHKDVKLIDYTGGPDFGSYVENLKGKTVFTEKAGVNSIILHSVEDIDAVLQNISFAMSLYSGQMCTAPQNVFIPAEGVLTANGTISYENVVAKLVEHVQGLANHPKMGAGTLGAIQAEKTKERLHNARDIQGTVVLQPTDVANPEFSNARVHSPTIIEVAAHKKDVFAEERFGPIVLVIKTENIEKAVALASEMAAEKGAITCGAYTTDENIKELIREKMEEAFTPVSFNLTGPIWMNQHAAFSDFHVTGGNPSGNASFTNPEFINRRYVWVGHRELVK